MNGMLVMSRIWKGA